MQPCAKAPSGTARLSTLSLRCWQCFEAREKLSRIGEVLGLSTSTVATILDNKEKIRLSVWSANLQAAQIDTQLQSGDGQCGVGGEAVGTTAAVVCR